MASSKKTVRKSGRAFLNGAGVDEGAAVQWWLTHVPANNTVDASLKVQDCDRIVTLAFDCGTKWNPAIDERIKKVDRFIAALERFKRALESCR